MWRDLQLADPQNSGVNDSTLLLKSNVLGQKKQYKQVAVKPQHITFQSEFYILLKGM